MVKDKSPLIMRANEILAILQDLEEELERNDNSHYNAFKASQEIKKKREELDFLRMFLNNSHT